MLEPTLLPLKNRNCLHHLVAALFGWSSRQLTRFPRKDCPTQALPGTLKYREEIGTVDVTRWPGTFLPIPPNFSIFSSNLRPPCAWLRVTFSHYFVPYSTSPLVPILQVAPLRSENSTPYPHFPPYRNLLCIRSWGNSSASLSSQTQSHHLAPWACWCSDDSWKSGGKQCKGESVKGESNGEVRLQRERKERRTEDWDCHRKLVSTCLSPDRNLFSQKLGWVIFKMSLVLTGPVRFGSVCSVVWVSIPLNGDLISLCNSESLVCFLLHDPCPSFLAEPLAALGVWIYEKSL